MRTRPPKCMSCKKTPGKLQALEEYFSSGSSLIFSPPFVMVVDFHCCPLAHTNFCLPLGLTLQSHLLVPALTFKFHIFLDYGSVLSFLMPVGNNSEVLSKFWTQEHGGLRSLLYFSCWASRRLLLIKDPAICPFLTCMCQTIVVTAPKPGNIW